MMDSVFVGIIISTVCLGAWFIAKSEIYTKEKLFNRREGQLLQEIKSLESSVKARDNLIKSLREYNDYLEGVFETKQMPTYDKEILDAVRYAMIHSHPDKGGRQEDFIKFFAVYEKMKSCVS